LGDRLRVGRQILVLSVRVRILLPQPTPFSFSINRRFAFIRHILALAVKDDLLIKNPASGIKFFPEAKRTRYFSDIELNHIQLQMKPEVWDLVAFAIETGMRREEQFSLRWDQVCLETSVITLPLPKGGRTRHVPLSEGAKAILRNLDSFLTGPWVFPSSRNPLQPRNAQTFQLPLVVLCQATPSFTPSSSQTSSINGFLKESRGQMAISHGCGNVAMPQYFLYGEKIDSGHDSATGRCVS